MLVPLIFMSSVEASRAGRGAPSNSRCLLAPSPRSQLSQLILRVLSCQIPRDGRGCLARLWALSSSGRALWSQMCPQPLYTVLGRPGCKSSALMLQPRPFLSPIHLTEPSHTRHPGPFPRAGTGHRPPPRPAAALPSFTQLLVRFREQLLRPRLLPLLQALQPHGPSAAWQIPGKEAGEQQAARWGEAIFSKMKFICLQSEVERRLRPAAGTASQNQPDRGASTPGAHPQATAGDSAQREHQERL